MFSSKSKSLAERTMQSGSELQQITEREATQTVGGCGGSRESRDYAPSTSTTPSGRVEPTVGGPDDAIL